MRILPMSVWGGRIHPSPTAENSAKTREPRNGKGSGFCVPWLKATTHGTSVIYQRTLRHKSKGILTNPLRFCRKRRAKVWNSIPFTSVLLARRTWIWSLRRFVPLGWIAGLCASWAAQVSSADPRSTKGTKRRRRGSSSRGVLTAGGGLALIGVHREGAVR